ncbi:MAG: hypothetical protein ACFCUS_09760 [Rubrimonas sp.]|uniref:hypothetical protein n=1 Tax=Rubrimonas sp. TaxID=2036015 RepID=UPI002FDDD23E
MTRLPLSFALAAILLLAVGLGWLGCWLWRRAHDHSAEAAAHMAELAARLHAAEAARDLAEARRAEAEAAGETGVAEVRAELASELSQTRAELAAAMDALGSARRETAEWRAAYEALVKEDAEDP